MAPSGVSAPMRIGGAVPPAVSTGPGADLWTEPNPGSL